MAFFLPIYILFNQVECLLWWLFSAYLIFQVLRHHHIGRLLIVETVLIVGFLFFGLSDYVEAGEGHGLPGWLWAWKLSLGSFLFILLVWRDYLLRGSLAIKRRHFVMAGLIFGLALYEAA